MKVFTEEQQFTQLWLHIILAVSLIISIVLISKDLREKGWQDEDTRIGFLVILSSIVLVYGLIYSMKLKTRIDEKGIQFRFIPFHLSNRVISWSEIKNVNVRKYNAIIEYGGWGLKGGLFWIKSKGVAYNIKGNIGLQLELKNGKKILIGTQKENDIKRILQTYTTKIESYEN
jgi:hypothetical protein